MEDDTRQHLRVRRRGLLVTATAAMGEANLREEKEGRVVMGLQKVVGAAALNIVKERRRKGIRLLTSIER